jgi:hypothetical protein
MRVRQALLAALFLLQWPAAATAGPIEFSLMPTGLWTPPGSHGISAGLVPCVLPMMNYAYDPATGVPVAVEVVTYDWSLVPPPPSNSSGVAHWNNAGPFKVTLLLTDADSGQSAEFELKGHIHMYGNSPQDKWGGDLYWQFLDETEVTLGGHHYVIWGINDRDAGPATVHVRVEPGSPAQAPEPGTLLLAALGLAPIALRRVWRR